VWKWQGEDGAPLYYFGRVRLLSRYRQPGVCLGLLPDAKCAKPPRMDPSAVLRVATLGLSITLSSGCATATDQQTQSLEPDPGARCLVAPTRASESLPHLLGRRAGACDPSVRHALLVADNAYLSGVMCLREYPAGSNEPLTDAAKHLTNAWLTLADVALRERCRDLAARIYGHILLQALPLIGASPAVAAAGMAYREHARSGLEVARYARRQRKPQGVARPQNARRHL
jgi:hypothetical protein